MAHNRGNIQLGLAWNPGAIADFPFINAFKGSQGWAFVDSSAVPMPNVLDSDGYPTAITNGGVKTVFTIPDQTARPGNYIVRAVGEGTIVFASASTTVSGSLTGVSPMAVVTPTGSPSNGSLSITIQITAKGASDYLRGLEFYHVDDAADRDAGLVFTSHFKAKIAEMGVGVCRFMDWHIVNPSLMSKWAHRKPVTYASYGMHEMRNSIYAGVTTNSGDDYSATLPGFVLEDKATVLVKFNASASGYTPTLNVSGTGAKPITWGGELLSAGTDRRPLSGGNACLVYDADLASWLKHGADASFNVGLVNGVPPEVCIALCNETNTHPYFCIPFMALDPMTDYTTGLATLCRDTLNSGLIPRFESCNEVWNYIQSPVHYAEKKSIHHWASASDKFSWMGKVNSTMGQAVSAVYSNDRSRYWTVTGVQTGQAPATFDNHLNSTFYLSDPPQTGYTATAAKNWITHVACTQYWVCAQYGTNQEMTDAYAYSVGDATAKMALINGYVSNENGGYVLGWPWTQGRYVLWKAWCDSFTPAPALTGYEGGWSPDYTGSDLAATINAATAAASVAVTVSSGFLPVIGMAAAITGSSNTNYNVSGTVTNVAGQVVTLNVNSSGFGVFAGTATLTYTGIGALTTAYREASKGATALQARVKSNFQTFIDLGGTFPAVYESAARNTAWSVMDPTSYSSNSSQFNGYVNFKYCRAKGTGVPGARPR